VNKHVPDCAYENNKFIIDLFLLQLTTTTNNIKQELLDKVDALDERVDAIANTVQEVSDSVNRLHEDNAYYEYFNEDEGLEDEPDELDEDNL